MDQFDRSRFYWANDHVLRETDRRSRPGPRGPLGVVDHDVHGRRLLIGAMVVGLVILLAIALFAMAADRPPAPLPASGQPVEVRLTEDASRTLVRPPGWIPSGLVSEIRPESG